MAVENKKVFGTPHSEFSRAYGCIPHKLLVTIRKQPVVDGILLKKMFLVAY